MPGSRYIRFRFYQNFVTLRGSSYRDFVTSGSLYGVFVTQWFVLPGFRLGVRCTGISL